MVKRIGDEFPIENKLVMIMHPGDTMPIIGRVEYSEQEIEYIDESTEYVNSKCLITSTHLFSGFLSDFDEDTVWIYLEDALITNVLVDFLFANIEI